MSADAGGTAWAVGSDSAGTLSMRWDTHSWHAVASSSPDANAKLFSVSVGLGGTAWAAGTYCMSGCGSVLWPVDRTLIMQKGTHGWHIVPTPKSAGNGRLISVSAGPDGTAWVGGYHRASGCGTPSELDRTLVLR